MSEQDRRAALAALRAFVRDRGEEHSAESLQGVADWLGRSMERIRQRASTVRFLRPEAHEQLTGVNEPFELVAEISAVGNLAADRVRFTIDGISIAEVPVRGGGASVVTRCDSAGVRKVRYEVLGPRGSVVQHGRETSVHVVDQRPVVLLDAELIPADDQVHGSLRELVTRDVATAWLDLGSQGSRESVAEQRRAKNLPGGAVLHHAPESGEPTSAGVFLRTAVRRLRASGVAITAFVTPTPERYGEALDVEVALLDPAAMRAALRDPGWSEAAAGSARALHARRATSDRLSFRLDETTHCPARPGNRCHVEFDNRAARQRVFAEIDAAQRRAELQVYIVEDGAFMDRLSAHLIRAARRGVRVRMLVDALYSRDQALGLRNPMLASLRDEPGVEVRANDPVPVSDLLELQALKQRDHRKLLVVDGRRAFVSGRNAGDAYYTGFDEVAITDATPHERIPWLDAHIEIEGPLVADVATSFERAWLRTGGEPGPSCEPPPAAGEATARLVVHEGIVDANGMAAYEALLDAAEDHVFILNDFPIVSTLVTAVRRALARGVRVCLLTGSGLPRRGDGTFFRGPMVRELFEHMTKGRLEPLMRRGLELYEFTTPAELPLVVCAGGVVRPYVHAKLMTVDSEALSVGSANLDATASYWEREANVVVQHGPSVAKVEQWILETMRRSPRIQPDDEAWRKELRVRDIVARLWPTSVYS